MEPVTLILTALATGAAFVIKEGASEAAKDTYHGLKTRIQQLLADKPEYEMALAKHEEKAEVWEEPLRHALTESGADKDTDIVQTAHKLMILINPQQAASGKYNVQITGEVQGFVQGDNAQVTMNFHDKPSEK